MTTRRFPPPPIARRGRGWRSGLAAIAVTLAAAAAPLSAAPVAGQRTFDSPEAAVQGLFDALISGDRRELQPLFGADTGRIAPMPHAGTMDEVRDAFAREWAGGHRIDTQGDRARLLIGASAWPYPVPIARIGSDRWVWDTRAGLSEITHRRIARNEVAAIDALHFYADAQHAYASADRDGDGVAEYARRIDSRPGRRDGLHWDPAPGEPASPLGPEAAAAVDRVQRAVPYRGYLFRILEGQGPAARGGAFDYRVGENMVHGFAGIAVPARYGRSGIHTFIINHDGRVWSRDFGPRTREEAARIDRFDPGPGWKLED
jgi:hypothetical protein